MNRGRVSTQVLLYFFMLMFLMFTVGCSKSDDAPPAPTTYTVTFDSQGATVAVKTVVSPATTVVTLPEAPTRSGYTFAGWWTEIDGHGTSFMANTPVTADITVYANWSLNPVYTVTYDSQGGNAVGAQYVTLPATTVGGLPTAPIRSGYVFGGWWTGKIGTGTAFTASTLVTANIKVYAKWNSYTYTVTFDSQGATVEAYPTSKTVVSPATTVDALPTAPTRTGYTFSGWWTGQAGTGTEFIAGSPVPAFIAGTPLTASFKVYAYWQVNTIPVYTVTYDSDGGTDVGIQYVTQPQTTVVSLPTNPTKSGYIFGGWFTAVDGGGTQFTTGTPVEANITVYAKWNTYTYTVTFNSQDATVAASPTSKTVDSPATTVVTLPTEPTKTDYSFGGWWTGTNGTGTEFTGSTPVTADIIVYAYWYTYTVTFDSQDATVVADPTSKKIVSPATTVDALPTQPTKIGDTFAGWWTGTNGSGTQFIISTPVTADITIYAYWSDNPVFTITYNSRGGTDVGKQYVTFPETTVGTLPTEPTRDGFIFEGWWYFPAGTSTLIQFTASTPVTSNITVYAGWGG